MKNHFGKAAACAGILILAGTVSAFYSETAGYDGPVVASSGLGVTTKIGNAGSNILANPATNGAGTSYFPAKISTNSFEILTVRAGVDGAPMQIVDREPFSWRLESGAVGWDNGELILACPSGIATMAANDLPGTPVLQPATLPAVVAVSWDASRSQLLLLTSDSLQSWQRVDGTFVRRGSVDLTAPSGNGTNSPEALLVDKATNTIYVGINWWNGSPPPVGASWTTRIWPYQWPVDAAQPVAGARLDRGGYGPSLLAFVPDGSGRISLMLDEKPAVLTPQPFPGAPSISAMGSTRPIPARFVVGAGGMFLGGLEHATVGSDGLPVTSSRFTATRPGLASPGFGTFANSTDAILAPRAFAPDPQMLFQVSGTPQYSGDLLQVAVLPDLELPLSRYTAATFQALQDSGQVRVAVYTGAPPVDGSTEYTLQWESPAPVAVTETGPFTVPFGGRLISKPEGGSVVALVWADRAGLLAETPSGTLDTWRLRTSGGQMVESFTSADLLQRAGSVAAKVVGESPATLVYAQVTYDGISQTPQVVVVAPGDFVNLEISETPDFAVSTTLPHSSFNEYPYTIRNFRDGSIPLYVRARGIHQIGGTLVAPVQADTVPPIAEPPVAESHYAPKGIMPVRWRMPVDPEPSSGLSYVELGAVRDGSGESLDIQSFPATEPTTYTLVLGEGVPGGTLRARIRGRDKAANVGEWALSEPFEVNAIPNRPTIDLWPAVQTAGDVVQMTTTATDPDASDTIVRYHSYFFRTSPLVPITTVFSNTLPQGRLKRGETWSAISAAFDNHDAQGRSTDRSFTIANALPTQPFVEIRPRTPNPGESIAVDVIGYSTDPDGDQVRYDFHWFKSVDGGATWIAKLELEGDSSVDGHYVLEGELWKVECVPYEVRATKDEAEPVAGKFGWDLVRVGGDNQPPVIVAAQPTAQVPSPGMLHVLARWNASDPEGGPVTVDVYLTDKRQVGLTLKRTAVAGSAGGYEFDTPRPAAGDLYLHLVARDNLGAITQVTTKAILIAEAPLAGWVLE